MPKVSIIVIVYKVEKFLEQCISSIRNQSYNNIEIICVVGDTDEACVNILEKHAKEDNRIVLIKQPPSGSAAARNAGLDAVSGDYIAFVDGDDYIKQDMIETMVNASLKHDADISVIGKYYAYSNCIDGTEDNKETVMTRIEAYETILYQESFFLHLWDKLYKKSLFDNIRFQLGAIVEDRQVGIRLLDQADKIVYNSASKYYFRVSEDSGSRIEKNLILSLQEDYKICDMLEKSYPLLKPAIEYFLVYETMSVIQNSILYKSFSLSHDKESRDYVRMHRKSVLNNQRVSKQIKIKTLMCCYFPHVFVWFTRNRRAKFLEGHKGFVSGNDWNQVFNKQGL